MSPDDPTLPPDARLAPPAVEPPPDAPQAQHALAPPTGASHPVSGPAPGPAPGEAATPTADSTPPAEPSSEPRARPPHPARGTRAWRVVRCPRWHARTDAHAPQREVYVWLSTRRATPVASRPSSSDPRAR